MRSFHPQTQNEDKESDEVSSTIPVSLASFLPKKLRIANTTTNQNPSIVARDMEKEMRQIITRTVMLRKEGKLDEALDHAKYGTKIEQLLRKHCKLNLLSSGLEPLHASWFNLATTYVACGMVDEALKTYTNLLSMQQDNSFNGRIRINMGNIYYCQKQHIAAIKMYKMALDQIQKDDRQLAHNVRKNIGNAYFCLGQIRDAIKSYEEAMTGTTDDSQMGFNLLICHLSLGDIQSAKWYFNDLIQKVQADENCLAPSKEEDQKLLSSEQSIPHSNQINLFVQTAARLMAPLIDSDDWDAGYDWVCNVLNDHHEELAIQQVKHDQAVLKLHRKEFVSAIKMLKSLQHKGSEIKSAAATNLSFLFLLEENIKEASTFAGISLMLNQYNAKALVNKANCHFLNGDFDSAKNLYLEAIGIQADCIQANYNLGLTNAQLGLAEEAITAFEKVHILTPNDPQVIFQIADIHDLQGRSEDAIKWFNVLAARVLSDPQVLARLGQVYTAVGEESHGLHYQLESFRHYPTDLDRTSLIGTWFVEHKMYERSCYFFQQATLIQPKDMNWRLKLAECQTRCGEHVAAFHEYERLLLQCKERSQRIDCLHLIVEVCKLIGRDSYVYQEELKKLLTSAE